MARRITWWDVFVVSGALLGIVGGPAILVMPASLLPALCYVGFMVCLAGMYWAIWG